MPLYKNVASQKIPVFAWDTANDAPKTGNAAAITAQISKDGGACAATNDTNPTELDATDAPGIYIFDMLQAETNADMIVLFAKSSTADITLEPVIIYTTVTPIAANVTQWNGTAVASPSTAGIPEVNVKNIANAAVNTSSAQLGVNVVNWKGSAAPAMTGDAFARLGAPVGASISADITTVDTVADNTYAIVNNGTYGNSALKGLIDIINGIVDAIKLKTDNIPASPAAVGSAMTLHADYDAAKTAASQTSVDAIDTVVDALAVAISELNDIDGDDVQTAVEARLTAARTALTEMPSAYTGSLVAILQALAIPGFGNTLFDRLTGALQFLKADGTTVLGEGTATDDGDETFKGAIETPAP